MREAGGGSAAVAPTADGPFGRDGEQHVDAAALRLDVTDQAWHVKAGLSGGPRALHPGAA
ncbi:hypothetical protein [Actinoplanes sp. RD1]|uniref:hypothetical protein n=1 Tax=Actinoplanes sp. RD1 TaxID=3064538 RepID=UPI00274207B2|nr:hypothetical protein [Actinoplanes sp. RD1]